MTHCTMRADALPQSYISLPTWVIEMIVIVFLIEKSSLCSGGSGLPLSLSEWSFTICLMPYNHKQIKKTHTKTQKHTQKSQTTSLQSLVIYIFFHVS